MSVQRIEQTIEEINQFNSSHRGVTRLAYSEEEQKAKQFLIQLCEQEGLYVRTDACGNVIARREGRNSDLPAVACGSHLDSVIQGGKYDGTVGVVAALEVIRRLNEKGIATEHPIELICFTAEESARFGVSTIGSKAMAGLVEAAELSGLRDKQGVSIAEAFSACGLNIDRLAECKRGREQLKAFFEVHIEQGLTLETENRKIGIVTGIAAPTRLHVHIEGRAAHSGSTAMHLRKDALLGAAEIALALERAAKKEADNGTVATVGVLDVEPGAMNIVPGTVNMKIDIRGTSSRSKSNVLNELFKHFSRVERERSLSVKWQILSDEEPVQLDDEVIKNLADMSKDLQLSYRQMPSGAGHDAMNMARICPTGLIFIPSVGGVSHHPDEYTSIADIAAGIDLLEMAIRKWAVEYDCCSDRMETSLEERESDAGDQAEGFI